MNIFLIDDDHLSLFLVKNTLDLEDTTHTVETFLHGSEALEALCKRNEADVPGIIFLDLNMPFMDGWSFLDTLEPLIPKLANRCKIYILTSSLDTADADRMKAYPMVSGLLHKPITSEDLQLIFNQYSSTDQRAILLNH